ncbi:putative MFS transporter [Aspergillus saccharolyticus JOP 1030-1]|uniref:Synaptic vesicle transporter n=1 Tax=Aspergillus saccharolyticus JOP 1030-1 TaxID=1450539 RepID=A0A319AHK9_9EURO|nr:synaptic vesicle transporter [Aspergillus saccharolyticus JOP 1030-1]PYH46082.1 synaptic vesicle transporter [Aspergillus saccharolyticus JOP 1030-1]
MRTSDILPTQFPYADESLDPRLKYDRTGSMPILLVPQPSIDANDPLNWPLWRRDGILFALCVVSLLCATTSSLMAANTVTIALYDGKNFTSVALLTGYHLCGVRVEGLLIVPTARIWGKPFFGRIFQGVALAPFEALVNACVGDLFYVHERGKRMALSNVALFGAAFLTPVLAGKITHSLGWKWTLYLVSIFIAAALPLTFFCVPETAFQRPNGMSTEVAHGVSSQLQHDDAFQDRWELSEAVQHTLTATERPTESIPPKEIPGDAPAETEPALKASYQQTLKPFNGRKSDESFLSFCSCLIQGVLIGWTVFIGVVLAAIFLGPPLWFDEVQTGYLYTGAFIGSILGLIISALLSDWMNRTMIKFNRGRHEPEFRILLVIFQLISSGAGLYGFGLVANDIVSYGWLVADIFFASVIVGMVMGGVSSALYIVDAHREIAIESFTCMLVFKNLFSFTLTFFAYNWLLTNGIRPAFLAIGSIQMGICALSVPMYVFGKWNRSFFHRHDILSILHLS